MANYTRTVTDKPIGDSTFLEIRYCAFNDPKYNTGQCVSLFQQYQGTTGRLVSEFVSDDKLFNSLYVHCYTSSCSRFNILKSMPHSYTNYRTFNDIQNKYYEQDSNN